MKIKEPSIVLVRPQLPENIGLTARAMYSCGLKKLIIVSPREKWPNQKSINSSAKAYKIINKTKVYTNLQQALSNFNFVSETSLTALDMWSKKRFSIASL